MKHGLLEPDVLAKIASLTLHARTIVDGLVTGLHRSPLRGRDVQFAEYREYSQGDELRHLDWKAYARSSRYYIKLFEQETTVKVHLLVDCSRSMLVDTGHGTKLDYAHRLAVALAYLFLRQGDSVGLVLFDGSIRERIGPSSSMEHLSQIASALVRTQAGADTQIAPCMHQVAASLSKRQVVVLISDLLDEPQKVLDAINLLHARHHELMVFQLLDPQEIRFEFHGALKIHDLESGRQIELDADQARNLYCREAAALLAQYEQTFRKMSVDYTLIETSETLDKSMVRALSRRHQDAF